jgi:hypothetical protein
VTQATAILAIGDLGLAAVTSTIVAVVVVAVYLLLRPLRRRWDAWVARYHERRRAEYAGLADRLGLVHETTTVHRLATEFPEFSFLLAGGEAEVIRGSRTDREGHAFDVVAGEFHVQRSRSPAVPAAFLVLGPRAGRLPSTIVLAEAGSGPVAKALASLEEAVRPRDIDFESAEFSARFHVQSVDRRFAYDLLDPAMIEHFLAKGSPPAVWIRGERIAIFQARPELEVTPATVASMLDWALGFADRISRVVRAGLAEGRYGGEGAR